MERGSNKQGAKLDDEMKEEIEPIERSGKEAHVEEHLQKEEPQTSGTEEPPPRG